MVWMTGVRFPSGKECCLRHHVQKDSPAHPTFSYMVFGLKRPEHKNSFRAEVWNAWILITMPHYASVFLFLCTEAALTTVTIVGDIHFDWSRYSSLHCFFLFPEAIGACSERRGGGERYPR
jgi:hypothetical protein